MGSLCFILIWVLHNLFVFIFLNLFLCAYSETRERESHFLMSVHINMLNLKIFPVHCVLVLIFSGVGSIEENLNTLYICTTVDRDDSYLLFKGKSLSFSLTPAKG